MALSPSWENSDISDFDKLWSHTQDMDLGGENLSPGIDFGENTLHEFKYTSPSHASDSGVSDLMLSPGSSDNLGFDSGDNYDTLFESLKHVDLDTNILVPGTKDEMLASTVCPAPVMTRCRRSQETCSKVCPMPCSDFLLDRSCAHVEEDVDIDMNIEQCLDGQRGSFDSVADRKSVGTNISTQGFCGSDEMTPGSSRKSVSRKVRGSIRVRERGAKLPSANDKNCNITSVKVLRIVNSSGNSTEDDVNKALEERNRKNAEMAKINRLKKKEYVGNLEKEVEESRQKIVKLEKKYKDVEGERDSLQEEVKYLRSVLANESALADLLQHLPRFGKTSTSAPSVSGNSRLSRKRVAEMDHDYMPAKKSCSTAGVCLHVDNNVVSVELCHLCSQMSKTK